jgi:spore germination protein
MPQYEPTSLFLNNLLATTNKLHIIPVANLFTFGRDLLDDGIDPVIPVIKSESDTIKITGMGLFQDTRYVESLDAAHFPLFALLQGRINDSSIGMEAQENKEKRVQIGLDHLSGNRKITVHARHPVRSGDDVRIMIELRLRGSVTEYTGDLNLQQTQNQAKLEAFMNRTLEAEAKTVMAQFKQHKVDPLGLGQYVRQQTPYSEWKSLQWRDILAAADVQVKFDVKIRNYGKIEQ